MKQQHGLKDEHTSVWQKYWHAGLRISDSKAKGAINGHKINSTMYYVLSQVPTGQAEIERNVAMNEGCYRGHHTLYVTKFSPSTKFELSKQLNFT